MRTTGGRPKTTWRRTEDKERSKAGWPSWNVAKAAALNRAGWADFRRGKVQVKVYVFTDSEVKEWFSIECRKTKTKLITQTNHNRRKQSNEPIRTRSKYMSPTLSAGKRVRTGHDCFCYLVVSTKVNAIYDARH